MKSKTGQTVSDVISRLMRFLWFQDWFDEIGADTKRSIRRAIRGAIIAHDRRKRNKKPHKP